MGRIKDMTTGIPGQNDYLVFDGPNGTKKISLVDLEQLIGGTKSFAGLTGQPSDNAALRNALEEKVDAVYGKGLSTNDYTNEEKQKLANILEATDAEIDAILNS